MCGKRQKSVNKAVPCPDTIVLQESRAEDRVPAVAETDLRARAEGEGKGAGEEITPGRSRSRQNVKGGWSEGTAVGGAERYGAQFTAVGSLGRRRTWRNCSGLATWAS